MSKSCPSCGAACPTEAKFCKACGATLSQVAKPTPGTPAAAAAPEPAAPGSLDNRAPGASMKGRRRIVVVAVAVLGVLSIGIVGAVLALRPSNPGADPARSEAAASGPLRPDTVPSQRVDPRGEQTAPQRAPTPTATPSPGNARPDRFPEQIPTQRTPPPKVSEWADAPTVELAPKGCTRKVVWEWLKLNCSQGDDNEITPLAIADITGVGGFGADYFTWEKSGKVIDVVVRMRKGHKGTAIMQMESTSITAGYDWTADEPFPEVVWR